MKVMLYVQYDAKGRKIKKPRGLLCDIDLDRKTHEASAYEYDIKGLLSIERLPCSLSRARVESIAGHGFLISGIEDVGERLRYQEWWCVTERLANNCVEEEEFPQDDRPDAW